MTDRELQDEVRQLTQRVKLAEEVIRQVEDDALIPPGRSPHGDATARSTHARTRERSSLRGRAAGDGPTRCRSSS